jgi:hypothetical protein
MSDDNKAAQMLERILKPMERLLETTQDMFILQALESGMTVRTVKNLLSVDTDRVTRVSKLRPKKSGKKADNRDAEK